MTATYIIGVLIVILFVLAIRSIIKQRKKGVCSCWGCAKTSGDGSACKMCTNVKKAECNIKTIKQ